SSSAASDVYKRQPETVAECEASHTARFLKPML
ncbi:hypothetical protein ACX3VG_29045, partial [Escherichia coli]